MRKMNTAIIERESALEDWEKVEKAGKLLTAIFPPKKYNITVRDGKIVIHPLTLEAE
jgi:hypothetical protein